MSLYSSENLAVLNEEFYKLCFNFQSQRFICQDVFHAVIVVIVSIVYFQH